MNKLNHITLGILMGFAAFSCTNGASVASRGVSSSNSTLSSTGGDNITATGSVPVISRVIIDPVNPGTFDLEGDGSNSIGTACVASGTTTSTTNLQGSGTSTCQCAYTYTRSSGVQEGPIYVNTSYFESNMVRCPYTTVPTDLQTDSTGNSYIYVSLFNSTSQQASTPSIKVPVTGTASGFDLTNSNNFASIQRYQCKDVVTISSPWSGGITAADAMYDPSQSEDPDMAFPLNYYTGNFGAAFSYFSAAPSSDIQNWNCPSIPNDTSVTGLDLRVWSIGADTAGSTAIYPPTGSAFDRSTFSVAKKASGIFNVPLNTYIAPTLYGQVGGTGANAPSGYGAQPNYISSTQETCGDGTTTNIPAGYQWAKLWLFRADLAHRYYRTSASISGVDVTCNPGLDSAGAISFPFCYGGNAPAGPNITYLTSAGTIPLADRIIKNEGSTASGDYMCVNLDGHGVSFGYGSCLNTSQEGPGCWTGTQTTAQFGAGSDLWNPVGTYAAPTLDPLSLLTTGVPGQHVPKDLNPTSSDLDTVNGVANSRYDFLYVVTPVTVMAYQMENTASSINYPYTPYRFPSKQDCQSSNPNSPAFSGDCNPSKIIHYGLKLHDISTNGDPGNTTQGLVYPMCVLQPL